MESQGEYRTLKDKLRSEWNRKDPKITDDHLGKFGTLFFWMQTISLTIITLLWTSPSPLYTLLCFYLFIQVSLNWFLCFNDNNKVCRGIVQPDNAEESGWTMCVKCQMLRPPRAHHCSYCKVCILKKELHCILLDNCVGVFTQRRFIILCFYTSISSLIGSVFNLLYVFPRLEFADYLPLYGVLRYYLYGKINFGDIILLIQAYVTIVTLIASLHFLLWQVLIVYRGQTSYEAFRNINRYRLDSPLIHIRQVFGPFWFIHFLIPLPLPIDADGVSWERHKFEKGS